MNEPYAFDPVQAEELETDEFSVQRQNREYIVQSGNTKYI